MDKLLAEACAWLRNLNRDRNGEDIAADIEANFPGADAEARKQHAGAYATIPKKALPEPEPEE